MAGSGYCPCKCRDCFEIAIADDTDEGAFCSECEEAGCAEDSECGREDAYETYDPDFEMEDD